MQTQLFGSRQVEPSELEKVAGVADRLQIRFTEIGKHTRENGLDFNQLLISHSAATFVMRAKVNHPQIGIHVGDWLVIDRSLLVHKGSLVIVVTNGELVVKNILEKEPEIEVWGVVKWVTSRR